MRVQRDPAFLASDRRRVPPERKHTIRTRPDLQVSWYLVVEVACTTDLSHHRFGARDRAWLAELLLNLSSLAPCAALVGVPQHESPNHSSR